MKHRYVTRTSGHTSCADHKTPIPVQQISFVRTVQILAYQAKLMNREGAAQHRDMSSLVSLYISGLCSGMVTSTSYSSSSPAIADELILAAIIRVTFILDGVVGVVIDLWLRRTMGDYKIAESRGIDRYLDQEFSTSLSPSSRTHENILTICCQLSRAIVPAVLAIMTRSLINSSPPTHWTTDSKWLYLQPSQNPSVRKAFRMATSQTSSSQSSDS